MPPLQRMRPAAMLASIRSMALIGAAGLCALLGPGISHADDAPPIVNEKFTDLAPAIKMLRTEVGQDRRDIVAAAMLLTPSEGQTFWPLYDQYRADEHKLGDRKVRLITDFIANRESMSEEQAEKLMKEAFAIEKEKIAIKENYVAKMSKALSARTVARFFQIDNKLDVVVEAALAARIPLIQ
jgi:hypothetical protein